MSATPQPMLSAGTADLAAARSGAPDFDGLAHAYRWMEYLSFGPMLMRCRTEFLGRLGRCRKALVIGDGDGRFTARLLDANAEVRISAVDASTAMLRALLRRAGRNSGRVKTEVADARSWAPASSTRCDLIVTHFFLDCLTTSEVRSLAFKLRGAAAPNALWVVSEFAVPATLFGCLAARPLVYALYVAFGLLTGLNIRTLPDYAAALAEAGFSLVAQRKRIFGLLTSEIWTLAAQANAAPPVE